MNTNKSCTCNLWTDQFDEHVYWNTNSVLHFSNAVNEVIFLV